MEGASLTVLGIPGSLRRESFNLRLIERAAALAPEGVGFDILGELGAIPHFNQDLEGERTPAAVLDLRKRIEAVDAIFVATPEYNGSIPGVLKNALDWASRPPGESVLAGKPAAVVGASPGRYGAIRAQAEARKVLRAIGAEVLEQELPVPGAHEVLPAPGALNDAGIERDLAALVGALAGLARVPPPAELSESAAYSRQCQRLAAAG
jgi:chromate reductase, NAD(P)H dehydrogenase (quinone)